MHCHACGGALTVAQAKLQQCTGCRSATYCGVACQTAHWDAQHAPVCEAVGAAGYVRLMARAAAGDAVAMYNVGLHYKHGAGVAKDEREAVAWYRRAAEKGNTRAQIVQTLNFPHPRSAASYASSS